MKAIVYTKYGSPDVLKLADVEKPPINDKEVLIKVYATTATSVDWRLRSFTFPPLFWLPVRLWLGLRKPKRPILGENLSGKIEAVGKNVKLFNRGDEVFGYSGFGANAEYVALHEEVVATDS